MFTTEGKRKKSLYSSTRLLRYPRRGSAPTGTTATPTYLVPYTDVTILRFLSCCIVYGRYQPTQPNKAIEQGASSFKAITSEYVNDTPGGFVHSNIDTDIRRSAFLLRPYHVTRNSLGEARMCFRSISCSRYHCGSVSGRYSLRTRMTSSILSSGIRCS